MITLVNSLSQSRSFYVDKSFSLSIQHDSKEIKASNGLVKFVDRGFTTYKVRVSITDRLDLIGALAGWLSDGRASAFQITTVTGEEIFGTHFQQPKTLPCVISYISPVTRSNFVNGYIEVEFTLAPTSKLTYAYRTDLSASISKLKYPHQYTAESVKSMSYAPIMGTELPPIDVGKLDAQFSASFELNDVELAEFLLFWEQNRHGEFSTPSLLCPLFLPSIAPSTLRIKSVGELRKERNIWMCDISFVVGSM